MSMDIQGVIWVVKGKGPKGHSLPQELGISARSEGRVVSVSAYFLGGLVPVFWGVHERSSVSDPEISNLVCTIYR